MPRCRVAVDGVSVCVCVCAGQVTRCLPLSRPPALTRREYRVSSRPPLTLTVQHGSCVGLLSNCRPVTVQMLPGYCPNVARLLPNCLLVTVKLTYGCCPPVVRLLSNCCPNSVQIISVFLSICCLAIALLIFGYCPIAIQ